MEFGFIGRLTGDESVVWKCEGVTDTAAVMSMILAAEESGHIPPGEHSAVCNACGAGERPSKQNAWFLERFRDCEVLVLHDCDIPGQNGAIGDRERKRGGWATAIAHYANSVVNVDLGYEIAESHGKDVRDWMTDQAELHSIEGWKLPDCMADLYLILLEMARSQPTLKALAAFAIADIVSQDDKTEEQTEREIEATPDDPHRLAEINLAQYANERGGTLRYWRNQWWKYRDGCYRYISDDDLTAKVTGSIKREFDSLWREEIERWENEGDENKKRPVLRQVKKNLTANVIEAMKSLCVLPSSTEMPSWLPDKSQPAYVSLQNGILSLDELFKSDSERDDSTIVLPHTSDWFSTVCLPYEFDLNASCPHWLEFLETTFNNDFESIAAIQRWFGYLLLPDTSLQKMLFVLGPPRSGKGTIARILTQLIGRSSIATPTLTDLAGQFCLQGLIGKTAAIVGDVRLSRRADDVAITERLLSITGEDHVDVHRKWLEPLNSVRLPVRFTLFSNELPYLSDSSTALLSRCIFIVMPNSYVGREDRQIGKRLETELPGILNWAIAGRYLLQQDGEILQPESGKEMRRQMRIISSPISSFIEDACERDSSSSIPIHDLFEAWCNWCHENGIGYQPNIQTFGKKMRDVIPDLQIAKTGGRGNQVRNFLGIKFKEEFSYESY